MTRDLAASGGVRPKDAGEQDVRSPMRHGIEALTDEDRTFLPAAEAEPITRFETYLRQHEIKPAHLGRSDPDTPGSTSTGCGDSSLPIFDSSLPIFDSSLRLGKVRSRPG
jgi:hypothetical protein